MGGSVGQTALNVSVGARTRWAAIWSGIWLLVILALFSGLVAKIAVPTLGAILIFAAIGSLQLGEVRSIMRTGRSSQVAVITTFGATLFLPVAAAVGIGVALSLLLQLNQEAMDLAVVELVPRDDGRFEERPPPPALTSDHVTILDVYGSLMYAGARTLQAHLPDPGRIPVSGRWCCGCAGAPRWERPSSRWWATTPTAWQRSTAACTSAASTRASLSGCAGPGTRRAGTHVRGHPGRR